MSETKKNGQALIARLSENSVVFSTSDYPGVRGTVLRLQPESVSFEIPGPSSLLRSSESLQDFKIVHGDYEVYDGRAVVRVVIQSGSSAFVDAELNDEGWKPSSGALSCLRSGGTARDRFQGFLRQWSNHHLVGDAYKLIIADIESFLRELRSWLDGMALGLKAESPEERQRMEVMLARDLQNEVSPAIQALFERFEAITDTIPDELQAAHRMYGQRRLHTYLLCAPFIHRTYAKPLGYAGDYEMMNMIVRNGCEGESLFARLINSYLLDQVGPEAVRNRVGYLHDCITRETSRVARNGRTASIYCVACGPAWEVVNFLRESPLADQARFRLLDFNEETLNYVGKQLASARKSASRRTQISLVKDSVYSLLRHDDDPHGGTDPERYDLIYCSGLYDYLNDRVIKALNTYFYKRLAPGGALVVGNFAPCTPVRRFIEHFLEWFLIYRGQDQFARLAPDQALPENCEVSAEPTGANIFLNVRKPDD